MLEECQDEQEFEDPVMLGKFLDFLTQDAINNPSKLVPFTEEMYLRIKKLTEGVVLPEDD